MTKLLYFAQFRETLGIKEEDIDLDSSLENVADLIAWQISRGDEFKQSFNNISAVRVAINQHHVQHDHSLDNAEVIAFFPPMTGG